MGETEFVADAAQDWVVGVKFNGTELKRNSSIPEGATLVIVAGMGEGATTFENDFTATDIEDAASELDDNSWFR